jgi:hypothetical protein
LRFLEGHVDAAFGELELAAFEDPDARSTDSSRMCLFRMSRLSPYVECVVGHVPSWTSGQDAKVLPYEITDEYHA